MKRLIVGIVIGVLLAGATTATAATTGWVTFGTEIKCKGGKSVVCYSNNRTNLFSDRDFSVYISRCAVEVWRTRPGGDSTTVFQRWQPYCQL